MKLECGRKKKKKKKGIVRFDNNTPIGSKLGVDEEETSFYDAFSNHPSEEESTNPTSTSSDPDSDTNSGVNTDGDDPSSTSSSSSSSNLGVGREDDDDLPPGLDCSLNPDENWGANAHSTCSYVLNTIASFTNFEASKSTPKYGFNRGMKEFGDLDFEATMKELDDNLIGMDAVQMIRPSEVNKDVWSDALSYLMFLKKNRDGSQPVLTL
jgi:hypothetical protein